MTPAEVLDLPLKGNIADDGYPDNTIRGYLTNLLYTLWQEGEGFKGKRPLGDSGWQADLAITLIEGGAMPGTIDEDGCDIDYNDAKLFQIIRDAIIEMCAK